MFGRLFGRKKEGATAARQRGDVHALDRSGAAAAQPATATGRAGRASPGPLGYIDEPRGGVQSDRYRHAEPTQLVDDQGPAKMGPGGTPQEDSTPEEHRKADRH
jgi:hypothetical protein